MEQLQSNQNKQKISQSLILLQKYYNYLLVKPSQYSAYLVQERLIYLMALAIDKKQKIPENLNLVNQLSSFIQKINIKVMSEQNIEFGEKLNLVSKCIDLLMFKPIRTNIKPVEKLLQLRVLCFNNLSCIYKQNKQYQDALKAVDVALQIEQTLLQKNYQDTFKSISSTYINKCVILSELSQHQEAINTIKTSLFNIEKYKQGYEKNMSQKEKLQISYMTMFAYFNIAVQHQHLNMTQMAIKFYEIAFKQAKKLGNWGIKNKIITALKKLKNPTAKK